MYRKDYNVIRPPRTSSACSRSKNIQLIEEVKLLSSDKHRIVRLRPSFEILAYNLKFLIF